MKGYSKQKRWQGPLQPKGSKEQHERTQDAKIRALQNRIAGMSGSGRTQKQQSRKSKAPQTNKKQQPRRAVPSVLSGLSDSSQAFLGVATDAFHPGHTEVSHPFGEVRPSHKYSCRLRHRVGIAANARMWIAVTPCPHSDVPVLHCWQETGAGTATSNIASGAATGVLYTNKINDSMFTLASSDTTNASSKYVGCGLRISNTGTITSRTGIISSWVLTDDDTRYTNTGLTLPQVFSDMTGDHRLRHFVAAKGDGSFQINHVNSASNPQFGEFARSPQANTVVNGTSGYAGEMGLTVIGAVTCSQPVMWVVWENQSNSVVYYDLEVIEYHERVSDTFSRLHTTSVGAPQEAGQVMDIVAAALQSHHMNPTSSIGSHIVAAANKQQSTKKKSGGNVLSSILKTAMKPQNVKLEEMVVMAAAG